MIIKLYKTNSNAKAITKALTNELTFNDCVARAPLDLLRPSITLAAKNLEGYNFMYIPELHRYYFINPTISNNGLYSLNARVDVLMSHAALIRAQSGILARSETVFNTYLSDAMFKSLSYRRVQTILFSGDPFSTSGNGFYLATTGGTPSSNNDD